MLLFTSSEAAIGTFAKSICEEAKSSPVYYANSTAVVVSSSTIARGEYVVKLELQEALQNIPEYRSLEGDEKTSCIGC